MKIGNDQVPPLVDNQSRLVYSETLDDDMGPLRRALHRSPRPLDHEQVLVPGTAPLRILVAESGIAVGHGVTERRLALDGAVATAMSRRTVRGVVVDHRVRALSSSRAPLERKPGTRAARVLVRSVVIASGASEGAGRSLLGGDLSG